jgi:Glycosyl hydrolases family 25/Putative peptidoglycan binding domain
VTVYYIDISSFQNGINLTGWHAVACKITQGTGYTDPFWTTFRTHAATAGAFFFGYHFLTEGNGAGQADHYFGNAGKLPCMIDFEPTSGSNPQMADAEAFKDRLAEHGCPCNLVYLPRWYWGNLGSPGLSGLTTRSLKLVSSEYTAYNDNGPGWTPYGGMTPEVWQYSSTLRTGGMSQVDANAFKGTFAQLQAMVSGTAAPTPTPAPAPVVVPAGDLVVPNMSGKSAGGSHNALAAAHLVPTAAAGQTPGEICTGTSPAAGSIVKSGADVAIIAAAPVTVQMSSSGSWVVLMQHDLNKANAGIKTDGAFGPATQAAVEHFQGTHALTADGVVGPKTWTALGNL